MTLHDGTVILPVIGRREGDRFGRHGFLTSSDGGETWERYVTAACDRYSGDEADFLQLPSGRILCVNRDPSNTHGHGVGPLFCTWSDDDGATWSSHEMVGWSDPRYGHSPALFLTRTGTVVCGYRHVAEMDHLHIGSVAFCYVKEEGLDSLRVGCLSGYCAFEITRNIRADFTATRYTPLLFWGCSVRNSSRLRPSSPYRSSFLPSTKAMLC